MIHTIDCAELEKAQTQMEDWLDVYTWHVPEHIAQMERVYQSWLSKQEKRA